jgi:hypothetical protein
MAEPSHTGGRWFKSITAYHFFQGVAGCCLQPFFVFPFFRLHLTPENLSLTHPQYLPPNQSLQAVKIIDILQKISRSEKESGSVSKKGKMARRWGYLPAELKPLFWDHDFHRLRWEKDRDLIIGRLISHGDWNALIWLRSRVDSASLKEWLLNRRGAEFEFSPAPILGTDSGIAPPPGQ